MEKQFTEISFDLAADTVVTNDTVKITCAVSVLINNGVTNENLKSHVKKVLEQFISGDWVFSNPTRTFDTGIEKAAYQAHIRVPATENYDLVNRATRVSSPGIHIGNVSTDVSIPEGMMRQAKSDLRVKLLSNAIEEAVKLSQPLITDKFSIRNIQFTDQRENVSKSLRAGTYAATAAFEDSYGEGAIGNSERVAISALVTLIAPNSDIS